jgi:mono/diheme cytochrome c family protein
VTKKQQFLFAALAASMLAGGVHAAESKEAQAGHNLYTQHCELCHGLRAQGDGAFAPELRVAPADLTTIALRRKGVFPEAELREIIDGRRRVRGHGPDNMPIWGNVFGRNAAAGSEHEAVIRDRVNALVDYLKSIQRAAPEAPARP